MSTKKALAWTAFWMSLAMIFNLGVYYFEGSEKALQFLGGYIIELSLSVDNLFLFLVIFSSFCIPVKYQRRVLNYGIAGAIIFRAIFVFLGVTVVSMFHWILYVFGIILLVSGIKMFFQKEECHNDFSNSPFLKLLNKIIPVTKELHGEKFFVKLNGKLWATPLFAIIFIIEGTDIMFAIDSIPAIFSISTDPFIIYSSNLFAIMGLRSLYFLLERLNNAFKYVKYGVAALLAFTGIKLSILFFHIEIPIGLSLGIIFAILASSVIFSVVFKDKGEALDQAKKAS